MMSLTGGLIRHRVRFGFSPRATLTKRIPMETGEILVLEASILRQASCYRIPFGFLRLTDRLLLIGAGVPFRYRRLLEIPRSLIRDATAGSTGNADGIEGILGLGRHHCITLRFDCQLPEEEMPFWGYEGPRGYAYHVAQQRRGIDRRTTALYAALCEALETEIGHAAWSSSAEWTTGAGDA
jgi:hypothetical protein